MKSIRIKLITGLLILGWVGSSSCKKFLEEDPKNQVTIQNFYQTESDAIAAVNAIYAYLNSVDNFAVGGNTAGVYHSTFWVTIGLASDEMLNNQLGAANFDQLSSFSHTPQNPSMEEIWGMHYKTITLANIAIARIPGISMNATLRDRLVGEAKFLRGLMYFNLVRMFGEVPLLLEENNPLLPSKATVEAIYEQIVDFRNKSNGAATIIHFKLVVEMFGGELPALRILNAFGAQLTRQEAHIKLAHFPEDDGATGIPKAH